MLSRPTTTPLERERNALLRGRLFRHLDGFPIAPTMTALKRHGVLELFERSQTVELAAITERTGGNEGYLQVALRLLCSQGWLVQAVDRHGERIRYTTTRFTRDAFAFADAYAEVVAFLPVAARMAAYLFGEPNGTAELDALVERQVARWGIPLSDDPDVEVVAKQILLHCEGLLVGPVLVALGMSGRLERFGPDQREVSRANLGVHPERLRGVLHLFEHLGWVAQGRLTDEGSFFVTRAAAYGVTVSYLPMFERVEGLLFGDPHQLWNVAPGEPEIHVDRSMNVWGSGETHAAYFKLVDEIVVDTFNRPIEEQPRGIADMGCGNGAFIEHIFDVIWERTERGKQLDRHPLVIVGSDLNRAALEATKATLERADVRANIVYGDIGDPHALAQRLREEHGIELADLLSVRSFLDHNRLYREPEHIDPGRESRSSGAFSFRGQRIPNDAIEQNLVDHLRTWAPHVGRFGLLVLELHTIPPKLAALNVGRTNVTAYDGTHGYSDQYILELEVFLKAAKEAGLRPAPKFQAKFPSSDLASISINLLFAE